MSNMIPNPEEYFRMLVPTRDALLVALEQEARKEGIPIVGPVVGELLFVLARATQARQILELGTATGYSAIYLARACEVFGGSVVTLERDAEMAKRAQANVEKAGFKNRVEIVVGEAFEEMTKMQVLFDFAFLDIDKESYAGALSYCERLLKPGGLLVADNVAFQGADEFNRMISADSHWRAVHLLSLLPQHSPEKDGLCLAVRV
jgi:predicted O-methyltransferase YrrM